RGPGRHRVADAAGARLATGRRGRLVGDFRLSRPGIAQNHPIPLADRCALWALDIPSRLVIIFHMDAFTAQAFPRRPRRPRTTGLVFACASVADKLTQAEPTARPRRSGGFLILLTDVN